jgi:prepilin-type N-terminal cleavage/methylation domain-containing protein
MRSRSGFTLIELMVAMIVVAILGTILARMLVQDSRFVSKLEAMMDARQTSRAAMTTISVEAGMVTEGGVTEATKTRFGFVVPFAWGIACTRVGTVTVGSLIPTDSMMFASAVVNTVSWLDAAGSYQSQAVAVSPSSNLAACEADSVRVLSGGQLVDLTMPNVMPSGSVFYLGESVVYEFRPSAALPGRTALWRQSGSSSWDELLAPFDTASGFGYHVGSADTANTNPPGALNTITGVELRLVGESQLRPEGASEPEEFLIRTRITFLNK